MPGFKLWFFLWTFVAYAANGLLQAEDYTYTTNNGAITITGYIGSEATVVVPASINGLPVSTIGTSAFNGRAVLCDLTLPASIRVIADNAFSSCFSLTNVSLAEGVVTIDRGAFESCFRLSQLAIPNSVTNIADFAFNNCSALESVTIGDGVSF